MRSNPSPLRRALHGGIAALCLAGVLAAPAVAGTSATVVSTSGHMPYPADQPRARASHIINATADRDNAINIGMYGYCQNSWGGWQCFSFDGWNQSFIDSHTTKTIVYYTQAGSWGQRRSCHTSVYFVHGVRDTSREYNGCP